MSYQTTKWMPGDGTNTMLGKLLQLFGGSPLAGDGTSELLRKLVIAGNVAHDGLNYLTGADLALVLAGYSSTAAMNAAIAAALAGYSNTAAMNAAIAAAALKDFKDGGTGDAVIYSDDGATEQVKIKATTGYLEFVAMPGGDVKRIYSTRNDVLVSVLSSTGKSTGAYFEFTGMNYPTAHGFAGICTIGRGGDTEGTFKVLNAADSSLASTTRLEILWWGDTRVVPVWNDGAKTFTGFKVEITNTASAAGSLPFNITVGGSSVYSVGVTGIASAKNDVFTLKTLVYNANTTVDFDESAYQKVDLTGDITFASANRGTGKATSVKVKADGSNRNLAFPAGWVFIGTKPASITANKTGVLSVSCFGANDADVVAAWAVEA